MEIDWKIILNVPLSEIVSRMSDKYFVQGCLHTNRTGRCCCNLYAKGFHRTAGWWNGRTLRFYSATDCSSNRITGCPAEFILVSSVFMGIPPSLSLTSSLLGTWFPVLLNYLTKTQTKNRLSFRIYGSVFLNSSHSFQHHIDFMNILKHRKLVLVNGHKNLDDY